MVNLLKRGADMLKFLGGLGLGVVVFIILWGIQVCCAVTGRGSRQESQFDGQDMWD